MSIMYERYGFLKIKAIKRMAGYEEEQEPSLGLLMTSEPFNDPMFATSAADIDNPRLKNTWETLTPFKVLEVRL